MANKTTQKSKLLSFTLSELLGSLILVLLAGVAGIGLGYVSFTTNLDLEQSALANYLLAQPTTANSSFNSYWVYIQLEDEYSVNKQNNTGKSKKGDIIAIVPATDQHEPTPTELSKWAIIKVRGLSNEDRQKYTQTWEKEDSLKITAQTTETTPEAKAYRQYKINLDGLDLKPGLDLQTKTSQFLEDHIIQKTNNDLISYERGRKLYALKTAPKRYALAIKNFIIPPSVAATEEISCVNGNSNAACNGQEDYNTLTLWEDATDNDLVASQVIAVAYGHDDDGVLDDKVTLAGATTNTTYYRVITAPSGERHNGVSGGFTLDPSTTGTVVFGSSENNFIFEWLNITGWTGDQSSPATAIREDSCSGYTIRNNLIHDTATTGPNREAVYGIATGYDDPGKIYNNIIFNLFTTGTSSNNFAIGIAIGGYQSSLKVFNNTIYNITNGGGSSYAYGVYFNASGAASNAGQLVNNAVFNASNAPFGKLNADAIWAAGTGYNACDLASVACTDQDFTNEMTNLNSEDVFTNKTNGDLHLKAGAALIDAGSDLSAVFTGDIDNGIRSGSWDIGADEYNVSGEGAAPPSVNCSDGTLAGQCSATKPLKCVSGSLVNSCSACGCNSGYNCSGNESCVVIPECVNGQTQPCGITDIGECSYGTKTCANNTWGPCLGAVEPATEICGNGIDEDCSGFDLACISSAHPRIWLNAGVLATLNARKAANTPQWQKLWSWANRAVPIGPSPQNGTYNNATQFALVYLLTGEAKYAEAAIYYLELSKNDNPSLDVMPFHTRYFSIAYDWLYYYLTPEQRADYRAAIIRQTDKMRESYLYDSSFGNYAQRYMLAEALAGYAIYGDDPKAQSYIDHALTHWAEVKAAFDLAAGDGASYQGEDYESIGVWRFSVEFLELMTFMTGDDYYANTIFEKRLQFLIYNLWPGIKNNVNATKNFRNGDYTSWRMMYDSIREQLLVLGNHYYDSYGKYAYWILNNNYNLNSNVNDFMHSYRDFDFIFYAPEKTGANISELPTAYYANNVDGVGVTIMKSDWGENQTYIGYICGNWYGGGHSDLDQGSFQIYSHKRELAISSGDYDGSGGSNAARWYFGRTISQNSLLIYNPDEHWDNSVRGNCATNAYGNDGGQRDFSGKNANGVEAPQVLENATIWETFRARCELCDYLAFKHTSDFDYIFSDLTNAYNNPKFTSNPDCYPSDYPQNIAKVSKVKRQLAYLRGANEYIVIFDDIVSTNASYKKTWLLHMIEQPILNGDETIVEGVSAKGIIQSTNSDLVTVIEGDRKLFSKTLLPASCTITRIGGVEGTAGHTATDYDQWVDGSNHYKFGGFYGKWRVEVSPSAPNAQDNFLHVLHPTGSSSMPTTTLIVSSDSKMKGALILDPVNPRIAMFSVDGTPQSTATYTANYSSSQVGKHLLVNMTPGVYDIYKNSVKITTANVGSDGALSFESTGGSTFQVVRAGEAPPTPPCVDGQQITAACLCGGVEKTSGYCCSSSWQAGTCPTPPPVCAPPQINCDNQCYTPVCANNSQCNDNNPDTTDTCLNPNTCNANCQHQLSPLEIMDLGVTDITTNSAMISWTTTRLSNSTIQYGLTNQYGSFKNNDDDVTIHNLELTGLENNTVYHFQVSSVDAVGLGANSANYTFTTQAVECQPGQHRDCGPDTEEGICQFGRQNCLSGVWGNCVGAHYPDANENCNNNLDDDCDGQVNEGCTPTTCSDGTAYGQCSTDQPYYCQNGNLQEKCNECNCPNGQTCQNNGDCEVITDDDNGNNGGNQAPRREEGQFNNFVAHKGVCINLGNSANSPSAFLFNLFKPQLALAQNNNNSSALNIWQQLADWRHLLSLLSLITTSTLVIFLFFFLLSILLFIHRTKDKFGYYPNPKLVLTFIFRHPLYFLRHLPEKRQKKPRIIPDPYHYWTSQTATIGFYGSMVIIMVKVIVVLLLLNIYVPAKVLAEANCADEGKSVKVGDQLTYRLVLTGQGSVQSFNDAIPSGATYVANSLYVGDALMTDSCLDSDQACFNSQTNSVEFNNIPMNTAVYLTTAVNGAVNPVVNVALGSSVNNPLATEFSEDKHQTKFDRLVEKQEVDFKDKNGNNKSLTIDKLESNQITFTYEGSSYTLTIGESKEINGYTFTATAFGEIVISQGTYQPPASGPRFAWQPRRPAIGELKKVNALGEQLSWGTVNRIIKATKAGEIGYSVRSDMALLTTYGFDDQEANWRFYAGVLQKYLEIYGSEIDWQDIYRITHGQKPVNRKLTREIWGIGQFGRIYWRLPKNSQDWWAVNYMAYDIRPINRNLASEQAAIKSFKAVYKRNPSNADDWAITRAIGYSGATRR